LGSRGSKLALWQAGYVKQALELAVPDLKVEIEVIKTTGDKILDVALSKIGA
jgi:hydroxymethylbilane synthase